MPYLTVVCWEGCVVSVSVRVRVYMCRGVTVGECGVQQAGRG